MVSTPTSSQRILTSFKQQALMMTIGAHITHIDQGAVTIEMPFNTALTQQHGFIHAGITTTLADNACGYAALSLMPEDAAVLTIEFKINFMSPAQGERFVARGQVLKPGSSIMVCMGDVHAIQSDGKEKLIASMLATMSVRRDTGLIG